MDQSSNQNYPGASDGPKQSSGAASANNAAGSQNSASVSNQGEIHASKAGTGPQTTHGHQVGQLVSEADHAPEFHAQTLPAGSAPAANTFSPNPDANDAPVNTSGTASAQSTITGASSADVHTGLGHPGQGQSSSELHDGSKKSGGLQGVGAGGAVSTQDVAAERTEPEGVVPGASGKKTGGDLKPGVSQMSKDEKYTSQLEQGSAKEENVRGQ